MATVMPPPFRDFAAGLRPQAPLRARITAAYRRPEPECVPLLIPEATLAPPAAGAARTLARRLVEGLRAERQVGGVPALIHEYALSSQEGVALMCLAEALLRIPDSGTRDALIRDKIGHGDWEAHIGQSPSLFVNAATWGLLITGRLTATSSGGSLAASLTRLIARGGEPLIRKGVDIAMRMMGEQFVAGQTIAEALANSRAMEAKGFRYSYDMLGEAALTAADATRYYDEYERAIHAIGKAAAGRGIYDGPGISVKLSALHPRFGRAQIGRVKAELLPRLRELLLLARRYDIGLNIDAEEADRLDISLDLLEALCLDPALAGWNGVGFVVQAYQKRAPFVIDHLIDMARRSGRRLMVRLVKGAYWDSEIKRAQVDGLEDLPVYTRKVHTDICFLACARRLLAAVDAVFPQFATHNAQTLASVHAMAGSDFYAGQYEFQCLHGMGEPLYEQLVGAGALARPCRIYAPVGNHETLLAYLVRRLLENGANTSFVHRIADDDVSIDELIADPVAVAGGIEPLGAAHPAILLSRALRHDRANAAGIDLTNEQTLAALAAAAIATNVATYRAMPMLGDGPVEGPASAVRNPADGGDLVGEVVEATGAVVAEAVSQAVKAAPAWRACPPAERAACLNRAADLLEARMPQWLGLIVREAGKSIPNAIGEMREAVDFLRYYANESAGFDNRTHPPLGPVACISPWNFPLAIFLGQVSASLAAGNVVLAKPAEETPLIAALALGLLHEAGVPPGAIQLLPGDGTIGAALVADPRIHGVVFTGSIAVARLIQQTLAERLNPDGRPVPLIAETGGLNAMVVDSSALPEQVVTDVLASAFDSAGQRCSALRVLCLQEDIADRVLAMLKGAMAELVVGRPDRLSTDIGPVITAEAREGVDGHVEAMRVRGFAVHRVALPPETTAGHFVAPTVIEIPEIDAVEREVFGPVLHVVRYRRAELDDVLGRINAAGYGLTFGLHSRIDETIAHVTQRIEAGNLYINRNMIGAVVGVQPFGGHRLSGTGPKAGGPLYLRRLLAAAPPIVLPGAPAHPVAAPYCNWLRANGHAMEAARGEALFRSSPLGFNADLPGPVGERNVYSLLPRGVVRCVARSGAGLRLQLAAAFATGNRVAIDAEGWIKAALDGLPAAVGDALAPSDAECDVILFEGEGEALRAAVRRLVVGATAIRPLYALSSAALLAGADYPLEGLVLERSVSTNTAAAGGNASLMSIG